MEERKAEHIGQLVKARTLSLQRTTSALAQRGLEEIARLETDPEVLRLVRILRGSGSWKERSDAWERIRKLGPGVKGWMDALKELIYAQDGWSRIFAAESLAINGCCSEDAVPVLVAMLQCSLEEGNNFWARVACGAIGKYKSLSSSLVEQATPVLLSALDSKDYNVIGYAAQTLSGFGSYAVRAIPKIVALANAQEAWLKETLCSSLKRFHPSIGDPIDALLFAITSHDSEVRGEAVCEIAKLGTEAEKAIPHLLLLANDQSSDVRRFLGFSIGKIGIRNDSINSVLRDLRQDEDHSVRLAGAYAALKLQGSEYQSSLSIIIEALNVPDQFVRFLAAWALGEVGAVDAQSCLSVLRRALPSEEKEDVRKNIEQSIKNLSNANI